MNTYRIMNKKTNQWWQGEANNAKEACRKATWPPLDCLIKWNPMSGNSGWMKCREEIKGEVMKSIINKDKDDMERLETVIRTNIGAFYDVGRALMEIRDRELYKIKNGGEYQTFEHYCREVWQFARRTAYQFIDSAKVIENVRNCAQNKNLPFTESQTRPLASLEPDQQREAWKKAVETAPEGKVTAAHVSKVVNELTGNIAEKKEKAIIKKAVKIEQVDPEFNAAWELLFTAVKNLKALKWKAMSRENALRQIQILIDVIEI